MGLNETLASCNSRFMSTRKDDIIEALIPYLLQSGLSGLSLRPMAAAAGTSARLLIFHFGSKEKLIGELLQTLQNRLRRSVVDFSQRADHTTAPLRALWDWALAQENLPTLKLLYELHILAAQNPADYAAYLTDNTLSWIGLVQPLLPPSLRSDDMAALFCAVFDGLFIDIIGGGDRDRATRALDRFIAMARREAERSTP